MMQLERQVVFKSVGAGRIHEQIPIIYLWLSLAEWRRETKQRFLDDGGQGKSGVDWTWIWMESSGLLRNLVN
jgi:hypothetical protein